MAAAAEISVSVDLAVGLGFSKIKRQSLEFFGANLIGVDMLENGLTPKEVVEWHLKNSEQLNKKYFFTNQFNNQHSVDAHEHNTGFELVEQIKEYFPDVTKVDFVSCAGTGASLTGIARALNLAGYKVNVILVEPDGCDTQNGVFIDHNLEGMSVGVIPPFVNWSDIGEVHKVGFEKVVEAQKFFAKNNGFFYRKYFWCLFVGCS